MLLKIYFWLVSFIFEVWYDVIIHKLMKYLYEEVKLC